MILSRIQQLQIRIEQSNEVAQSIKSPRATHEDELAAIHQSARQELENLSLQGSVSQEVLISSSEKVMIYGGQAQKLKDVYNARAKDEEAAYEHALEEIWKKLCVDLCEVFGSRLIDEVLQEQRRPNASPRASSSSSSSNNDSTSQESRASDASHGGSPSESPSLRPTEATTSNLNETGEQQRRHQPLGNVSIKIWPSRAHCANIASPSEKELPIPGLQIEPSELEKKAKSLRRRRSILKTYTRMVKPISSTALFSFPSKGDHGISSDAESTISCLTLPILSKVLRSTSTVKRMVEFLESIYWPYNTLVSAFSTATLD